METSHGSLLSGSSWENQPKDAQMPVASTAGTPREKRLQDEIISVYEVFVKEDSADRENSLDGKPELSIVSAVPIGGSLQQQNVQGDGTLDLDAIDIISADGDADDGDETSGTVEMTESEREAAELEALQSAANASEENMVVCSQATERPSSSTAQLIDKDDPRSRLHYVKYLKRDGKTLKIWECGLCAKEFRHQYTLMRHLPTHTDERNFKCDVCGKAFRQLSTLSQHKAIHSDARPYVCEFCKKTFNRVSTLISHRKTHSEHKPHKCHLCGKGFHQKGNLRNHVFTHTNERPYKCEICAKGFNQMSNLVCHKVKAHAHCEKMQYSCNICGKEFPRRSSLRSHEEFKHGIKYRQSSSSQTGTNESKGSKKKSVRVVHESEEDQPNTVSDTRDKEINMTEFMENIIIDRIETQAMETALLQGQTPFALFKPAKGIPVLVKVTPSGNHNHLLTPATADDLKMSGQMDSSFTQLSDIDGSKSVQIKVPVVATVTEGIQPDGKISFLIEPPGPDQEQDSLLTPVEPASEALPCEEEDDYSQAQHLLNQQTAAAVAAAGAATTAVASISPTTAEVAEATDDELLELAASGGIQFVRPTEDGRYELVTNTEARNLMAQNSHDVQILGAETADGAVISVHGDFDYLPLTNPDISTKAQHQHAPEIILPDSDDIMVLDPNNDQKALTLGDIEILQDKDLRPLLDPKYLEDQYDNDTTGATYLSPAKIDEILNAKSAVVDTGINLTNEITDTTSAMNQSQLSSILNHRTEFPPITSFSSYNHNPQRHLTQQQQYQQYPNGYSIPLEPAPYMKSCQSFTDDYGIIFGEECPPAIDYSSVPEYPTRLKLSEFEDDPEAIFTTIGQANAKVITQKNPGIQMFDGALEKQHYGSISERSTSSPIKFSEDKISPADFSLHYEEPRLSTFDQFYKNTMYDSHFPNMNLATPLSSFISDIDVSKKNMQSFERPLELKYNPAEDQENKENKQIKALDQLAAEGSHGHNGSAIAGILSSIENFFEKEQDRTKTDSTNFLQVKKLDPDDWTPHYTCFILP